MAVRLGFLTLASILMLGFSGGFAFAQKQGGTLRVTHRDNPPSASIHEEATISTDMPFMAVFNNLVIFDPESPQNHPDRILPELATSWSLSEEGRKLTFQLRDGVRWHDGKPFSSADVKCTWDGVTGRIDVKMRKNPRKTWWWNIKDVTTNGPREVTFHLENPQPSLLVMLAGGFSPVYPCHVSASQMRTAPIGTGPFKFVEFKQNEGIKLARNPDYWKPGKPYLDAIEYTIITSRATAILALVSGRHDMTLTGELNPENAKEIQTQVPQMQCLIQPSNTQGNLLINRDKPPFDDARLRKALGLAIDRKAFSEILSRGINKLGGAMLAPPEGIWGWSPEFMETVPGYGGDVEKNREEGRKIMRELGFGPDKMMPLKVSTRNVASYRDASVILIDHIKSVYIQGELEVLDSSVWYAKMLKKDYAVGMNVQGTGIDDPDVQFFENYKCGSERNYTGYCNPELEKLYLQQSRMTDLDARRKLVWDIDKKLQEDGARPVIYQSQGATCWWPHVKGLKLAVNSLYNHWRFDNVWLER